MAREKRIVRSAKTLRQVQDKRKVRTPAVAYIELASLSNEKSRLAMEVERWEGRNREIQRRLAEISEKEQMLLSATQLQANTPISGTPAACVLGPKTVATPRYEIDERFETKEFEY